MALPRWLKSEYQDIKGNFKYDIYKGIAGAAVIGLGALLIHGFQKLPSWVTALFMFFVALGVLWWVGRNRGTTVSRQSGSQGAAAAMVPTRNFDATDYFKRSYHSPLQTETEANVRAAADQNQPDDREGFYVKLISTGAIGYVYDIAWAYIFRSQLQLLSELNARVMPLTEVRPYYDHAAAENGALYAGYPFERWVGFLKDQGLITEQTHTSIAITERGRDFLKYLIHWGKRFEERHF